MPSIYRTLELPALLITSKRRDDVERISRARVAITAKDAVLVLSVSRDSTIELMARYTCCVAKTPSKSASARKRRSRLHSRIELSAICALIWTGYDARKGDWI